MWPVLPSYRNQSTDLLANQLTGFYMRATLVTFTEEIPYGKLHFFVQCILLHSKQVVKMSSELPLWCAAAIKKEKIDITG